MSELGGEFKKLVDIADDYDEPFSKEIAKMADEFAQNGEPAVKKMIDAFQTELPKHIDATTGKLLPMHKAIAESVGGALEGGFGEGFDRGMDKWAEHDEQLKTAIGKELKGGFGEGFTAARTEYDEFTTEVQNKTIVVTVVPDYDAFYQALQDIAEGRVPDTGG